MASKKRKRKRRQRPAANPRVGAPAPEPVVADDAQRAASARRRATPDGPPPAPWGSFPLSEIVVLVAIVMLVAGFFTGPPQGAILLGAGLVLGSLAGLELSVREHFSGYRSHTLLLAGAVGVATVAGLAVLSGLDPLICLGVGVGAFGAAAYLFAGFFRRSSGGSLFRIKPFGSLFRSMP
jgi:hypothetical protein